MRTRTCCHARLPCLLHPLRSQPCAAKTKLGYTALFSMSATACTAQKCPSNLQALVQYTGECIRRLAIIQGNISAPYYKVVQNASREVFQPRIGHIRCIAVVHQGIDGQVLLRPKKVRNDVIEGRTARDANKLYLVTTTTDPLKSSITTGFRDEMPDLVPSSALGSLVVNG